MCIFTSSARVPSPHSQQARLFGAGAALRSSMGILQATMRAIENPPLACLGVKEAMWWMRRPPPAADWAEPNARVTIAASQWLDVDNLA